MKRGKFIIWLLSIFLLLGLSGCDKKSETTSSDKPVKIEFWYGLGGNLGDTMQETIDTFNQSQDDVEVIGVQQSDYFETKRLIQSAIASGKVPATVLLTNQQLKQFDQKRTLQHLDQYIAKDKSFNIQDFIPALMDYCKNDAQKIMGLPVYGTTQVMYYNKKIFKENNIDPNEAFATWQNLAKVAKQLTVQEYGETSFFGWEPMYGINNLKDIAFSNGAKVLSDDGKTVLLDSDEWIESWEAMRKWINEDKIMGIYSGGDGWEYWYKTIDDVMQNRAAGYTGSNGDQGDLDFSQIAAHIQPGFGSHRPAPVADPITCAILDKASDKEKVAGFKWLNYLTNVENTVRFSMNTGYTPVRESALNNEKFKQYLTENPQAKVPIDQLEYAQKNFIDPTNGKIDQILSDAADLLQIENVPAKDVLKEAQKKAQKALDEYLKSE